MRVLLIRMGTLWYIWQLGDWLFCEWSTNYIINLGLLELVFTVTDNIS